MKKKNLLILFLLSMFIFIGNVDAKESISCPDSVFIDDKIICTINIDKDPVIVETDPYSNVEIDTIGGTGNTKTSEYKAIFNSSGKIVFTSAKETNSGYVNIILSNKESSEIISSLKIKVMKKTTSTTTTTTKKKSSNNYLSFIEVDNKKLSDFSKNKTKYYVEVSNEVNKVIIDAKSEDDNAKIDVNGPKTLLVGENEYTISVIAEDDSTKFYKVIISRLESEEELANTNIKSIKIKGYNLDFDTNVKTFYLPVKKDTTSLNMVVDTEDDNADVEITGNENLKNGSIIKIKVITKDGASDIYRIIIEKEKDNKNALIGIVIITVIIIITITFIIVINKRKKNNGNDKHNKDEEDKKNSEETNYLEKTIDLNLQIDNDDTEKTKILSYENVQMEDTKVLDDEFSSAVDDLLDKTIVYENKNKEN